MTKEEYEGIEAAQIALSRLASTLNIIASSEDGNSGPIGSAIDLCADMAHRLVHDMDQIPGFIEAQNRSG